MQQDAVARRHRAPCNSISFVTPCRLTLNSLPVFDWTMTSVRPFGVASMPFALKFAW